MNIISMQTTIQLLYKTISGSKKKERFETILEPLQALIQIGFLSYYPVGTKLTILAFVVPKLNSLPIKVE